MALLGASGCGKSMTLGCIAGIVRPDKGHIELNGRVLFDSEKKIDLPPQKRKVGYLFQQYALFPHMTVEQNIRAGAHARPKNEREQAVREVLHAFRLEGLENNRPAFPVTAAAVRACAYSARAAELCCSTAVFRAGRVPEMAVTGAFGHPEKSFVRYAVRHAQPR
ncbi:MAG: ATP-binding cassette domain-containing protein [Butyricicoccus sp.]